MREFKIKFWLPDGDLFGFSEAFADEPAIERGETYRMEVLDDGTVTNISTCTGPAETVRDVLTGIDKVINVKVADGDPTFYYVHFEPSDITREMMRARRETSLALEMPIEWQTDGSVVATFVGDQRDVSNASELIPEEVEVEVLTIPDIEGDSKDPFSELTGRQREVLSTAVKMGYYEDPRAVTQDDIAAELDLASATVGEHLRRVEATVLDSFRG